MPVSSHINGWVLYDGDCKLCRSLAARFRGILHRFGVEMAPLQESWVVERLALPPGELLREMRVLTPDGATFGGADAVVWVSRYVWWAAPLRWIAAVPGGLRLLRVAYRWIAAHRNCRAGTCAVRSPKKWIGWAPLGCLPPAAAIATRNQAAWEMMWALAFAIFAGCKWLTWWEARAKLPHLPWRRSAGYLLLWPGMDAGAFCNVRTSPPRPASREWIAAGVKTAFGALLLWSLVPSLPSNLWLLRGWIGMIGIVVLLHFGIFHLLALAWRTAKVGVEPLMNWPLAAKTIGEFWKSRWNRGFNDLARRYAFEPVQRRCGTSAAMLATFLISGALHELVITVPARAGYGLPTLYFLLQGAGIWFQKSRAGKAMRVRRGTGAHLFAIAVVAGPAFWLFPPQFVARVVIPFLKTIGSI